ncbi:MAG: FHA domain-containing protein [Phormidesmis sp.]
MITCPNCNHQNPDGALQCEACYTPLPAMMMCPSCHTPIQADASFCGQCGSDLRDVSGDLLEEKETSEVEATAAVPESALKTQNFLAENELAASTGSYIVSSEVGKVEQDPASSSESTPDLDVPELVMPDPLLIPEPLEPEGGGSAEVSPSNPSASNPFASNPSVSPVANPPVNPAPPVAPVATQLQSLSARLRQVQTNTVIEIPRGLSLVRIGKPNEQTPPDIDVSGFPDSEVVSRVHANLRVEGDVYYVEDVGSSNGTYVNGLPLAVGNRHRLRPGDRIALGKGDKISFIFETA